MPDPNSQPGIFNAIDTWGGLSYGMVASSAYSSITAQNNARALQAAIDAAQVLTPVENIAGAIILIPSYSGTISSPSYGSYYIDTSVLPSGSITIPNSSGGTAGVPLLIMGTGEGTALIVMSPAGSTLFSIEGSSFVTFQDLTIIDQASAETNHGTAFALNPGGGNEGYQFFRLNIQDFPQAISVGNQVVFANILQCYITYGTSTYSGAPCTAITDSGAQTNIEQCSLTFNPTSTSGMTGISIVGSSYARVVDTQISGFETGLQLGPNGTGIAKGASFTGLEIKATGSCLVIQNHVYDACFVNCTLTPTNAASPPSEPAIMIGASTDSNNDHYDTIRFTACTVTGYGGYGLAIYTGQNIQVNGGTYSGNGTAGIAILGAAAEVQITGANCVGSSQGSGSQDYGIYASAGQDIQILGANCSGSVVSGIQITGTPAAPVSGVRIIGASCLNDVQGQTSQQYGIYVLNATTVLIEGCALTGNEDYAIWLGSVVNVTISACDIYSTLSTANGIYVAGSEVAQTQFVYIRGCNGAEWGMPGVINPNFLVVSGLVSDLEVTDCAGYNDQGAILANTTNPPSGTFGGVYYNYYGASAFYVASTSTDTIVTIDAQSTYLTSGGFTLAPGETATVSHHSSTTHFLMVGK